MTAISIYQFGPFRLDRTEHRLSRAGIDIPLQPKAFEILCVLAERAGRLLTKDELLRVVWPDSTVEENNLNKNISLLRKVLGDHERGQSYIETVPRLGYRFAASVMHVEPPAVIARVPITPTMPEAPPRKSVAVMYFENLSEEGDCYLRDGMTEDVITELEKIRELRLFPRSAVLAFRDRPEPVTQIGEKLRADFVLEGSIRRDGTCLRITARLSETVTGHAVWAERFDRRLEDVFDIQDEIARSIALALRVVLTETEKNAIAKVPTSDIQAYDYYLRGRQFFYQLRRQGLDYARQMFARAIVIDPGYARAYAGVADCCSFLYMWFESTENNAREALSASRKAVELDPESPVAHASLGLAEFVSRNYDNARAEFETALGLSTELFEAYYFYGRLCFTLGEFEKAAELFCRANLVNPSDFQTLGLRGLCFRALGRKEDAREAFQEALEKAEQHLLWNPDDVRAVYKKASALHGLGQYDLALEWTDRALAMDPEDPAVLFNVACNYVILNQTDKGLDLLEKSFSKGFGHREWIEQDPDFASVRNHPRFKAMLKERNLVMKVAAS